MTKPNSAWGLRSLVACVAACLVAAGAPASAAPPPAPPQAPTAEPEVTTLSNAELRKFILSKLTYDRDYFQEILKLESQGRPHPLLSPAEFAAEVKRARANAPVLKQLFKDVASPPPDGMLRPPPTADVHREYSNLVGLLNMMHANEKLDFRQVLQQGERLRVQKKEDFGHVRGDSARYYVNLYRLYFFLMAFAHYSLGQDGNAVEWLARLEADANLKGLKDRMKAVSEESARNFRLDVLRGKPVAVTPFAAGAQDADLRWAEAALTEVITTDLVRSTDLVIVERTQLDRVLDEAALAAQGFVQDNVARDIGRLTGAGLLLMGTFSRRGAGVMVSVRLVDSEDARVLAAETAEMKEPELFAGTRDAVIRMFTALGWERGINREELVSGRVPSQASLKTLHQARLAMSTQKNQARELFARAVKEDPSLAHLYDELRAEFRDVSATVAVMDVANLSADDKDAWMARGILEGLSADLPRLGFSVVERSRLDAVLDTRAEKAALAPEEARGLGQQLGADFVVLGSLMHQRPRLRVDLRFVDVRTGVIAQSVTAESRTGDLMAVLSSLSSSIAAEYRQPLTAEQMQALAGKQRTREDFERFVRAQMAGDALRREAARNAPAPAPAAAEKKPARAEPAFRMPSALTGVRVVAYGFAAVVIGSAVLAVLPAALLTGVSMAAAAAAGATQYQLAGFRASAEDESVRQNPGAQEQAAAQRVFQWLGVSAVGAAVLAGSFGIIGITAGALAAERIISSSVSAAREMRPVPEAAPATG